MAVMGTKSESLQDKSEPLLQPGTVLNLQVVKRNTTVDFVKR